MNIKLTFTSPKKGSCYFRSDSHYYTVYLCRSGTALMLGVPDNAAEFQLKITDVETEGYTKIYRFVTAGAVQLLGAEYTTLTLSANLFLNAVFPHAKELWVKVTGITYEQHRDI